MDSDIKNEIQKRLSSHYTKQVTWNSLYGRRNFNLEGMFINFAFEEMGNENNKDKKNLSIEQFFDPSVSTITINKASSEPISKITIYGESGIGNSLLSRYLGYCSTETGKAQSSLWSNKFDAVFVLPLGELIHIDKKFTYVDFIYSVCLSDDYKSNRKKKNDKLYQNNYQLLLEHLDKHSKKILFILDGWDEVEFLYKQKNTPQAKILNELLDFKNLILTSKPYSTSPLMDSNKLDHRILKNIGFQQDKQIYQYVSRYFNKREQQGSDFIRHLELNYNIRALAYNPMQLEMLCSTWESKYALPNELGMTDLYQNLVNLKCKNYLENLSYEKEFPAELSQDENASRKWKKMSLDNKKEFIINLTTQEKKEACDKIFLFLEQLAFESMNKTSPSVMLNKALIDNLVYKFKKSNGQKNIYQFGLKRILKMSFLKGAEIRSEKQGYMDINYSFLNPKIQEYFTACYLSKLLDYENNKQAQQFIAQFKYNYRYENVMSFTAGLLKENSKKLTFYWKLINAEPKDITNIKHSLLTMRLFEECIGKKYWNKIEYRKISRLLKEWSSLYFSEHVNHDMIGKPFKRWIEALKYTPKLFKIIFHPEINKIFSSKKIKESKLRLAMTLMIEQNQFSANDINKHLLPLFMDNHSTEINESAKNIFLTWFKQQHYFPNNSPVTHLISLLKYENIKIHEAVIESFSVYFKRHSEKNRFIIHSVLMPLLQEKKTHVVEAALKILLNYIKLKNKIKIGDLTPHLHFFIMSDNEKLKNFAIKSFSEFFLEDKPLPTNLIIKDLIPLLTNKNLQIQLSAGYLLADWLNYNGQISANLIIEPIFSLIKKSNKKMRGTAVIALSNFLKNSGCLSIEMFASKFLPLLSDTNENIQLHAIRASSNSLRNCYHIGEIELFNKHLNNLKDSCGSRVNSYDTYFKDNFVREATIIAYRSLLISSGISIKNIKENLISLLNSRHIWFNRAGAKIIPTLQNELQLTENDTVIEKLILLSTHKNRLVRKAATNSILSLYPRIKLPNNILKNNIMPLLKDSNYLVKMSANLIFYLQEDFFTLDTLTNFIINLLNDGHPYILAEVKFSKWIELSNQLSNNEKIKNLSLFLENINNPSIHKFTLKILVKLVELNKHSITVQLLKKKNVLNLLAEESNFAYYKKITENNHLMTIQTDANNMLSFSMTTKQKNSFEHHLSKNKVTSNINSIIFKEQTSLKNHYLSTNNSFKFKNVCNFSKNLTGNEKYNKTYNSKFNYQHGSPIANNLFIITGIVVLILILKHCWQLIATKKAPKKQSKKVIKSDKNNNQIQEASLKTQEKQLKTIKSNCLIVKNKFTDFHESWFEELSKQSEKLKEFIKEDSKLKNLGDNFQNIIDMVSYKKKENFFAKFISSLAKLSSENSMNRERAKNKLPMLINDNLILKLTNCKAILKNITIDESLEKNICWELNKIEETYTDFLERLPDMLSISQLIDVQPNISQAKLSNDKDASSEFDSSLKKINDFYKQHKNARTCFICYAWPDLKKENNNPQLFDDSKKKYSKKIDLTLLQACLTTLRSDLKKAGITTFLDIMDNESGNNIYGFMDKAQSSSYVLLIGTPDLLMKHKNGFSAVCNELIGIKKKRESDSKLGYPSRVYPLLFSGTGRTSFPNYLELYSTIRDWQKMPYAYNLQDLIREIYGAGKDNQDYKKFWSSFNKSYPQHIAFSKEDKKTTDDNKIVSVMNNNEIDKKELNNKKKDTKDGIVTLSKCGESSMFKKSTDKDVSNYKEIKDNTEYDGELRNRIKKQF